MNGTSAALVHAVRGPVLLITLGVLLTLDHLGAYGFWRLSPILLIVFGLFMLVERALARPAAMGKEGNRS